jgi:hypothetical protein
LLRKARSQQELSWYFTFATDGFVAPTTRLGGFLPVLIAHYVRQQYSRHQIELIASFASVSATCFLIKAAIQCYLNFALYCVLEAQSSGLS